MAKSNYCATDYLPSSFKGVNFQSLEVSSEHGRRGAEGEFVFGERSGYADLGRKIRRYSISARFQENNHVRQAARLIRACESPGPGTLVHPVRGAVRVGCTSCKIRDNVLEERGVTNADMEFIEAGSTFGAFNGSLSISFGNIFGISISGIVQSALVSFTTSYRPKTARYYDATFLRGVSQNSMQILKDEFYKASLFNASETNWKTLSSFDDAINNESDLKDASKLFANIESAFKLIERETALENRFDVFRKIANSNAAVSALSGISRDTENSVYATMRVLAASYMARASVDYPAKTLGAALQQIDRIMMVLEGEAEMARLSSDHLLFIEIRKFITEVNKVLLNRAYTLPSIISYDLRRGMHSLMAAHEIFGDARRFPEIESRNPQYFPWSNGIVVAPR